MENIDPKRCEIDGCRGWALRGNGRRWCVAHCPAAVARANEGRKLARRGLRLPPLDSAQHAKRWFAILGSALAEKRLKPSEAAELRRLATAYLDSDPSSILTDRLEAVEGALQRLQDKDGAGAWQG